MYKNNHNKNKNQSGFTLVELIVVLVILAILAAIMIPALLGYIDKSKKSQCTLTCHDLKVGYKAVFAEDYAMNCATPMRFKEEVEKGLKLADHSGAVCNGNPTGPLIITGLCKTGTITAVRGEKGEIFLLCSDHGGDKLDDNGSVAQASGFTAALMQWLADSGDAFGMSSGSSTSKGAFFAQYYNEHPEDIVQMSDEYKSKLVAAGLNNSLKNQNLYWWTYPVTDNSGKLLYTVTYASNQSDAGLWTSTNRGKMNAGYVVIVNGKTYYRSNSGATVQPGNSTNPYKTEDELEAVLIANGYKVQP